MSNWTEKHRREAAARVYELAAREARKGSHERAQLAAEALAVDPEEVEEQDFRDILFQPVGLDLDVVTIDREVARARALAEGRLVRETVWRVRNAETDESVGDYGDCERDAKHDAALDQKRGVPSVAVRVVRIRRATR